MEHIDIVNILREEEKKGLLSQQKTIKHGDALSKKYDFFNDAEKYQVLFNNASDLIAVVNRKGNFIDLNKKFEEESLYSKEEMLGKNVLTSGIVTKESASKIRLILQKIIQEKPVPIIEIDGVTKKGGIVPYELRAVPLYKDGKIVASQAILRNITERRENKKTLMESEHKFRSLVEQAAEMLFLHEVNGRIVDVNRAAEKNTGYCREELLNMTVFDIDPDAYDEDYKQQYWNKMKPEDKPVTVEVRHRQKDGTVYPTEVTISKVEINDAEYILALARDITDRKKAEEALKDREEKFRLLAENSVDCIWMLDKKLRFTYLSPSLEHLTGFKPEEWMGTKLRTHFRKKEFLRIGFIVAKALKDYKHFKPVTFETKILNKEHKEIDVEITGNVLFDEHGKLKGLQGATRDISERKKAEKEIQRANDKLKKLNQTLEQKVEERTERIDQLLKQKDDFINQLGHDLKNPLGPFLQLLPILENHVSNEKDKHLVQVLKRNANYMRNLVKKTIDLAKLNSDKTPFSFEIVSLKDLVSEVVVVNSSLFEDYDVVVENNVPSDCLVQVDQLHIEEVFTNLFNNAVKYSEDEQWIGIDAVEKDDCVLVSVRDKSIGISEEQLPFLFDEYYKADSSRHDFESSGLGLPICKRIIEKHGGRIWAESEGIGKGSTFYFTLPKIDNQP